MLVITEAVLIEVLLLQNKQGTALQLETITPILVHMQGTAQQQTMELLLSDIMLVMEIQLVLVVAIT